MVASEITVEILKALLVVAVAFLYAAVGHGGATGYVACLGLFGLSHETIAGTALMLNTVVAGLALFAYARAGYLRYRLALPFMLSSVPLAFWGAQLSLNKQVFAYILAFTLLLSALRFLFINEPRAATSQQTPSISEETFHLPSLPMALGVGGVLGLVSGIVGIGGGVFLSPLILLKKWGCMKQTAAASALFIVANSISGLLSRGLAGTLHFYQLFPYLPLAIVAALAGSYLGAKRFSSRGLQRILAVVLLLAAFRLFLPAR
ncbi:MAG: sulfite exporter TauE/SafE family protein [Candidatus Obscuribacter sp.]|nr:sulfite exporter TauE/SafE family protein [Candidatus Obscuribacter sp.]